MLGNLFNKAKDAASQAAYAATSVANAARGVEEVDWIRHAFPYRYSVSMFADDSTNLKRPEPPVGTDPAAVQYANQWYAIWESVRDGHMAPVSAIENGDVPGASSALAQWRQQIEAAATETARLGDFNGNRILVASDDEVHQALEGLVSLVEEYVGQRLNGEVTEDTATDAIGYVIGVHTTMNDAMQAFYNDPTGAGYRAVEDAAFAPLEAMRQQVNPNAPELAPIEGISLHDYVAGAAKMHTGMNADQICQVLGVERPQWERACKGWMERVQQHPMSVGMQYSTLMSQPHPLLDMATAGGGGALADSQASRLNTDRDFYIECAAAMAAATEAGRVAETYLEQNYRVTTAEVASAGTAWMSDMRNVSSLISLQQAKQKEIAAKLQAEIGPGLADDIQF